MNFNKAEFKASYGTAKQLPLSDRIEIAFSGRSNVGKSSAINKIFNRKSLARVSGVPGKTATINFYNADTIYFVDLPGYGYAKVAKSEHQRWSDLMEGYFNQERNLKLVVALVDIRHAPSELDKQMISYLKERKIPFIVLLTKSDKLSKTQVGLQVESISSELDIDENIKVVPFSAKTGFGVEEIKALIEEVSNC